MKFNFTLGAIFGVFSQIAPFLLPTLFFESGLLTALSPIAIFLLTLRNGVGLGLIAVITNTAFLFSLQSTVSAVVGAWLWITVGVLFPTLIRKTKKPVASFAITYGIATALLFSILLVFAAKNQLGPIEYIKQQTNTQLALIEQIPNSPVQKMITENGREAVLKQINTELPSAILIFFMLVIWLNLLFASHLTRGLVAADF